MSMNPVAAPKTLRYEPDAGLPVAIEAKSNRRYFYPTNGAKFGPKATNVIRMTLNANSFLDFSHSYLQFKVTNTNAAAESVGFDHGVPFFNRLQVMSGGQELEDIQEYSRLYSILSSVQGSRVTADETSLTQHQPFAGGATASALAKTNAELTAALSASAISPGRKTFIVLVILLRHCGHFFGTGNLVWHAEQSSRCLHGSSSVSAPAVRQTEHSSSLESATFFRSIAASLDSLSDASASSF